MPACHSEKQAATIREWGTPEWFRHLHAQGDREVSAYYAQNGYQLHRVTHLADLSGEWLSGVGIESMVDIGCGNGALTSSVARRLGVPRALGIDFVDTLIQVNRHRYPGVDFQLGSLPELEQQDASFDLAVASEVLYYLDRPGRARALDEIRRVLKRGGFFLFSSVLGEKYFTPAEAVECIGRGFEVVRCHYAHYRLYHLFAMPLYRASRLHHMVESQQTPGSQETERRLRRYRRFLESPPARFALRVGARLARPLLESTSLPAAVQRGSRFLAPQWTQTNITVLARKQ